MRSSRERCLLVVSVALLAVLAGCASTEPPVDSPTAHQATTSVDRVTATETPLPDRTVALPEGPKEPPTRPDELNEHSAAAYVEAFEYRYVYNQLWLGPTTVRVDLECTVRQIASLGIGYRIAIDCTGWSESDQTHADYFTQRSVYLVDEDSLVRRHVGLMTPTPEPTGSTGDG